MPDLDQLRSLGEQIRPPALSDLEDLARRRQRNAALVTAGATVAAVLIAVGGVLAMQSVGDDRSVPDPLRPLSPTPTPTPDPGPTPTPTESPTHQSETSMTPREVVLADNAQLAYTGVSADDTDFRVAAWSAECTWCAKIHEEDQTRPFFHALAVTTDGFETTRYARPPRGLAGIFVVHSPAPGTLLIVDDANGGEWLVNEDGSTSLVPHVAEEHVTESPRPWFSCRLSATDRTTWCTYDADDRTVYEWGGPWAGDPGDTPSAVSPGTGAEPWGRALLDSTVGGAMTAWWYQDGVRRTRDLEDVPRNSTYGSVLGAVEGDLLYWAHDRGAATMRFFVGDDLGASWRTIEQGFPADSPTQGQLDVLATPSGRVLMRQIDETGAATRTRLWRLDSLEEGTWQLVHDTGATVRGVDTGGMRELTVVGSRLWSGTLSSADDGRTWIEVDRWR